jgi:hypothetical protein
MAQDKQLCGIELGDVLKKRQLAQALNAKEFAVLVGISYSTARGWFRLPGFPVIEGLVFWDDFVQWRRTQTGLTKPNANGSSRGMVPLRNRFSDGVKLPERAAQLLSEVG